MSDKTSSQVGKSPVPAAIPSKDGDTSSHDAQIAHYEAAIAALPEGSTLRDNLKTQMLALQGTLPPETRPGVRVDQATACLTRVQKLKVELEEKLLMVEAALQDNSQGDCPGPRRTRQRKARAFTPSTPVTEPGSTRTTFNGEQSAELHAFLLSCQTSMASDPVEKERAKRHCSEGHEPASVMR